MTSSNTEGSLLRLAISDTAVLRACYMPFLQRKGLFVPSLQTRRLGEKIFVVLRLSQQNLLLATMSSVCWITPKYCGDGREAGFGLHFDEGGAELSNVIESILDTDKDQPHLSLSYTL